MLVCDMSTTKELDINLLITKIKSKDEQDVFEIIAKRSAPLCGVDTANLYSIFKKRRGERTFGMGNGIAIFDVKSPQIKSPLIAIMTLKDTIDFNALDGKPVDIIAAIISPQSCGPFHLQRLASISRILRSTDLCAALRDVNSADAMQALFMPSQDWMVAA